LPELIADNVAEQIVTQPQIRRCCDHCVFYYEFGLSSACRRRAPTKGEHGPLWPWVSKEHWCGEFEPKPEAG
jgi:hypothetical protein